MIPSKREREDDKAYSTLLAAEVLIGSVVSILTLQHLWNWFIVPIGAIELSFAHSFGLLLISSLFSNTKEKKPYSGMFHRYIAKNVVLLTIGFVLKDFI